MARSVRGATARVPGAVRVWALTTILAAASVGVWVVVRHVAVPLIPGPLIPLWLLAFGFAVAEVFVMHLRIARHTHSFSLSEIPLVLGIVFVSPGVLAVSQAVGIGVALAVHRRQKPIRLAFNIAQRSFTALVAFGIVATGRALVGDGWTATWVVVFGAMLATDVIGAALINAAISLSEGRIHLLDQVVGVGTALTFANTALALLAAMVVLEHAAAVVLVAVPAVTTFLAGRAYADLQRKHENLKQLQRSMGLAQRSLHRDEMIPDLLDHLREMFNAEIAELILCARTPRDRQKRYRAGPGHEGSGPDEIALDPSTGLWARVATDREAMLLARPIHDETLRSFSIGHGINDAVVAPVTSADEFLGILTVRNRFGDFTTFDRDDLELLQTVANHLGVALRNSQLVERLEASLAHETEVGRLKDDFVATISHELRTPLTNVQGYLRTLLIPEVELSSTEEREFLVGADRNAERLKRLIEDLLYASRVEGSGGPPSTEPIGIAGLLERVVAEAGPGRERVILTVPEMLPLIESSDEDVYRVVRNLVDNALKYSPIESPVIVSARTDESGVTIRVRDSGPGILGEERHRIFERFYQVDQSTTRRVGGTGMGLYICRRAAERLGGRVWLERSGQAGSVFAVWLPLDPRRELADEAPVSAPAPA